MPKSIFRDYLAHYNPNHDPRNGRFARSPGGSSRRASFRESVGPAFEPGPKGKPSPAERIGRSSIEAVDSTKKLVRKQKTPVQKDYSNLSNSELQSRINRLQMEKRYSELSSPDLSKGRQRALDVLDITGDVMAIGVSAAVIGAQVYKIKKLKG